MQSFMEACAYTAGLIDGEGSIQPKATGRPEPLKNPRRTYVSRAINSFRTVPEGAGHKVGSLK